MAKRMTHPSSSPLLAIRHPRRLRDPDGASFVSGSRVSPGRQTDRIHHIRPCQRDHRFTLALHATQQLGRIKNKHKIKQKTTSSEWTRTWPTITWLQSIKILIFSRWRGALKAEYSRRCGCGRDEPRANCTTQAWKLSTHRSTLKTPRRQSSVVPTSCCSA